MHIEPIQTERILLRKLELSDSEAVQLYGNAGLEFLKIPSPYTLNDAHEFIQKSISNWESGSQFELGIEFEGRVIGAVNIHKISLVEKHAEIGYAISKFERRKGLMYESICAFIDALFSTYGFERLMALIRTDNEPSIKLVEKLGFVREGTLRKHQYFADGRKDMYVYGLLKSEWSI